MNVIRSYQRLESEVIEQSRFVDYTRNKYGLMDFKIIENITKTFV